MNMPGLQNTEQERQHAVKSRDIGQKYMRKHPPNK